MRVLVVASQPTDADRGDPSPASLVVRGLAERGHEVHLVCDASEPMRSYDTLTVWPVHSDRAQAAPTFALRAMEASHAARPQLVLADRPHLALGWTVAKRCRGVFVPVLSEPAPGRPSAFEHIAGALDAKLIRGAPACVTCGPIQTDAALALGATRAIELPGVTSIEPIERAATGWLRRHLGLESGMLAIAWGQIGPDHGTDILIEGVKVAADADHDIHAAIFGGDEATIDRYDAKAERLGIHDRVHLVGGWHASKLETLLPEADVLVEAGTQTGRTPAAIYSLLASSRPVILAEVPGRERVVDPKACLFTPADRLGIGHALSQLAANEAARSHYAAAGRATVATGHTMTEFIAALGPLERLAPDDPDAPARAEPTETDASSPSPRSIGA